jgi:uridine monophosphate synthetase
LNKKDNLGLVVGATHPDALARVRIQAPDLWILAPGIGAQEGDLKAAMHAGLREDGMGLIIAVSRAISRSDSPNRKAIQLRDEINRARSSIFGKTKKFREAQTILDQDQVSIADGLLEAGCVKFGDFTLKSGIVSPIYLDLRLLVGSPKLLGSIASAYLKTLNTLSFDRIAALPYAALPIGSAISLESGIPMIYPRKEVKSYGTQSAVEGPYYHGECAVVIDDLATTGGSKFEAIERLRSVGLRVNDVVVLIDRQSGASQALSERGYKLHSLFTLTQLLDYWEQECHITNKKVQEVRKFLSESTD